MRMSSVPRRHVLKLGAAVITCSLFATTSHASAAGPSPAPAGARRPAQGAPTTMDESTLTGVVWLWQRSTYADGMTVTCADPSTYTLAFLDSGLYSVQADCNTGSGGYTVDGSQLTLKPGPMTLAACGPGSQDDVFRRDLLRVASYVFDGDNLVLNLQADSGNMVFSPRPPVSLTGPTWQVLGVNNGHGGVASVVAGTQLDVTFGEDGIVSGSTGCNRYRGLYVTADPAISFGPLATTRRACASDEAAAQEQAFLAALAASTRYELQGSRLTLRNDAGATQVNLTRPTG
jgi:heat shock protein HslJ